MEIKMYACFCRFVRKLLCSNIKNSTLFCKIMGNIYDIYKALIIMRVSAGFLNQGN